MECCRLLSRLRTLYRRYQRRHAHRLTAIPLQKRGGRLMGRIEQITIADNTIRILGWSVADTLTLQGPDGTLDITPNLPRPDVREKLGLCSDTGFDITVRAGPWPLRLACRSTSGDEIRLDLPHPMDPPGLRARLRFFLNMLRDFASATPAALRWAFRGDPVDRQGVKRALGFDDVMRARAIDPGYLSGRAPRPATCAITIIVPIHDAHDMATACLERLHRNTDLPWQAILIDDASTDPRMRPMLRSWVQSVGPHRAALIEQDESLGFVGSVNAGFAMAEASGRHVVILNSDAMVPPGWASRLFGPIDADNRIASVTPMSNNAEILSVPVMVQADPFTDQDVDRMDAFAATLNHPPVLPDVPTGVGFCMAMSRAWLSRVPRFDNAFAPGYGEEVDWCQKTRALGGRHVGLPSLFVEHRGGASFGSEAKADLVRRGNARIACRYPSYDAEVQDFIATDPLATPRLAMGIAQAAARCMDTLPLFVAHSLGGGAEHALEAEIAARTERDEHALVLRVGGVDDWRLELHGPLGVTAGVTDDLALIKALLRPVKCLRVVYSCGVGAADAAALPGDMLSLCRPGHNDCVEARVHDYFMVSPSYCLLNADGRYFGPDLSGVTDPAHRFGRPGGRAVPLEDWHSAWGNFLTACSQITVFSEASRKILLATYPDISDRIVTRAHALPGSIRRVRSGNSRLRTLGVLGDINLQKGAGVLRDLGARLPAFGLDRIVVIGNVDPTFALPSSVHVHGSYQRSEIADLAERYGVSAWLMPSIWPETFSFTTHEMLATGLPVIGFDLGAQGDALAQAANGIVVPYHPDEDLAAMIAIALQDMAWQQAA